MGGMRGLLGTLLALCAGCAFDPGAGEHKPLDASPMGDVAADRAGDTPASAFCDPQDPTLVACFELDGSTSDRSGSALSPMAANVTFVPGRVGMAAHFDATTSLDIPETAALDVPAVTIEAWIRAAIPGAGLRSGVLDNQGQYSLYLYPAGALRCHGFDVAANISAQTWTHVACTYDGANRVYVNGMKVGEDAGGGGALATIGTTGISIGADNPPGSGSPLLGEIDQLRIFSVARTDAQIAAAAVN